MVGRRETEFWLPIISDISIEDYMLLFSGVFHIWDHVRHKRHKVHV